MTYLNESVGDENFKTAQGRSLSSLSELWAKKYVENLSQQDSLLNHRNGVQQRTDVARNLSDHLRSISAQAWNQTESLLAREIRRHQIGSELIDPWAIAQDVHRIYSKALSAYADGITPQRFSVLVSSDLGKIRKHHTAVDPRVIGFLSMQFHYCGQLLLKQAPTSEQEDLENYCKVIDDHLYMPLQRAYEAAANYHVNDPRLKTVQTLLPYSSTIAVNVVETVNHLYPNYVSYTGRLNSKTVRTSSVRDVEMFQVYLWTCLLEESIAAITQELFPLCVMLYPTLRVNWELVRQMISLLGKAFKQYEPLQGEQYYRPYYEALWTMFSPEVFPEMPSNRF